MVIRVENLSKKYIIGHQKREPYKSLRDEISNGAKSLWQGLTSDHKANLEDLSEEFWALKDVSFEIKQGDRVGIIGRNGAGKSTLLKILSRITEPTAGKISIRGRVTSLLEVGTGFHPELTGRENIYLNGAILGMDISEIKKKFDEIVAFAEVEKFLDTPVKRYSSGMYVRLAFAVAAHLEPEILIVDEVLAVGDAQFQKKCLGKMEDVGKEGRTVLFVSHQMSAIRSLCDSCVLLDDGKIKFMGEVSAGIQEYSCLGMDFSRKDTVEFLKPVDSPMYLDSVELLCNNSPSSHFQTGDSLSLKLAYSCKQSIRNPKIGLVIYTSEGNALLNANNHYQLTNKPLLSDSNSGIIECHLGQVPFMEGRYSISFWFGDSSSNYHCIENAIFFEVIEHNIWGTGKNPPKISPLWWSVEFNFFANSNS